MGRWLVPAFRDLAKEMAAVDRRRAPDRREHRRAARVPDHLRHGGAASQMGLPRRRGESERVELRARAVGERERGAARGEVEADVFSALPAAVTDELVVAARCDGGRRGDAEKLARFADVEPRQRDGQRGAGVHAGLWRGAGLPTAGDRVIGSATAGPPAARWRGAIALGWITGYSCGSDYLLAIGDWGLGTGIRRNVYYSQSLVPNPQSPTG